MLFHLRCLPPLPLTPNVYPPPHSQYYRFRENRSQLTDIIVSEGTGLKAVQLTDEHKPNSPVEQARIESLGGRVEKRGSVHRVAWKRVRQPHKGPIRRSTTYETVCCIVYYSPHSVMFLSLLRVVEI
eukprot:sb/3475501/